MSPVDLVGAILGFVFTLLVFSYILGDNPLFRLTVHIFIGVAAGYAAIMTIDNVLLPRLLLPLFRGSRDERLLALAPLVLGGLLLTKISPKLTRWGTIPLAYLVGVGAAVAIGGAVSGTLIPQVMASINLFDLQTLSSVEQTVGMRIINSSIILIGTIATLAYFHFGSLGRTGQPSTWQRMADGFGQVGQVFIAIIFGFLFAGVYSAAMLALIERLFFLVDVVKSLLLPLIAGA